MDKLKWTKVGPGNAIWPKSGRFMVRLDHGGEGLVNGEKGEEIWPRSIVAIAGPIDIAEPEPVPPNLMSVECDREAVEVHTGDDGELWMNFFTTSSSEDEGAGIKVSVTPPRNQAELLRDKLMEAYP